MYGDPLLPVIVSASRETDVSAFYAGWLVHRLRDGWCAWKNPFNGEVRKVSFSKTRIIVFWSKNPKPMLDKLSEIEALGFRQYYFQFTLNDYMAEGMEPNVPPVAERIETFKRLADRIGKERVIWRFDPLMLTEKISIDALLERVGNIGQQLKGYTEKLVFSFIDIAAYRKVQKNLAGLGVGGIIEPCGSTLNGHEPPEQLRHHVLVGVLLEVGARQLVVTPLTNVLLIYLQPFATHHAASRCYQVKQFPNHHLRYLCIGE